MFVNCITQKQKKITQTHFEHRYRAEDLSVQKRTLQNGSIMLLVESVMKW